LYIHLLEHKNKTVKIISAESACVYDQAEVTFTNLNSNNGLMISGFMASKKIGKNVIFIIKQSISMNNTRVFKMAFAGAYPHYIQKAEKKGRTKAEVDEIIYWLTGYSKQALQKIIDNRTDFETFFAKAPQLHPNVSKITGVICGYRVEEIEDKLMQKIRYLDKLVDELAKGKAMDKILRK
jgi:hypothetical protein